MVLLHVITAHYFKNYLKLLLGIYQNEEWIAGTADPNTCRDIVPQLKTLIDIANKVWQTNLQIVSFMIKIQSSAQSPELGYTWVQEPVKFEDALGRIIPIPSEYNWGVSITKPCHGPHILITL